MKPGNSGLGIGEAQKKFGKFFKGLGPSKGFSATDETAADSFHLIRGIELGHITLVGSIEF